MSPVPDLSFSLIKISGALALVIGLLLLLGNWLKSGKFSRPFASNMNLEMLGAIPLGMKKSIALVRVADRILVVGIGGERIQLLDTIRDSEQIARLEKQDTARVTGFGKHLKRLLKQDSQRARAEEFCSSDDLKV